MTAALTEPEALFSAAYDGELSDDEQRAFDQALASDADLARKYRAFCDTMSTALTSAALESSDTSATDADAVPTPDLLPGVQRRLRARSGGRFYGDRFSEKTGKGLTGPLTLALIMLSVCALAWLVFSYIQAIDMMGP